MNRAFLEAYGLEKETIDAIMTEHGRSVEKQKRVAESYRSELDEAQEQLADFKKIDVNGLQQQFNDLQTKYDTETKSLSDQLLSKDTEYKARDFFGKYQFASDRVKNSVFADFMAQGFELTPEGAFAGADEFMKELQEKEPDIFGQQAGTPTLVKGGNGNPNPNAPKFEEMTYSQQVAFLTANPNFKI